MTKLLGLTFLAALAALVPTPIAQATPAPAEPAKPVPTRKVPDKTAKCMPSGAPIFEADKTTKDGKGDSSIDTIYETGAWQHEDRGGTHKEVKLENGQCISDADLTAAKAALAAAKWQVTKDRITCKAFSNDVTIYSVGTKEVFRETICSGEHLDDKSAAALEKLKVIVKGPGAK